MQIGASSAYSYTCDFLNPQTPTPTPTSHPTLPFLLLGLAFPGVSLCLSCGVSMCLPVVGFPFVCLLWGFHVSACCGVSLCLHVVGFPCVCMFCGVSHVLVSGVCLFNICEVLSVHWLMFGLYTSLCDTMQLTGWVPPRPSSTQHYLPLSFGSVS